MAEQWRVGRKLGRTLYRNEVLVGMMDTPELADEVVVTMNELDWRLRNFLKIEGFRFAFIDKAFKLPEPADAGAAVAAMMEVAEAVLWDFLARNETK